MKKGLICLVIIGIIVGVVIFVKKKEELKVEIKDVNMFHLSYSKGYMMNANIIYRLDYDTNTKRYIVSVKPYLVPDEQKLVIKAPDGFREKIKEILIKYNVNKWNGFDKTDKDVLDGDSFSLYVKMDEEQKIDASGYMQWPENYKDVISEFDTLFMGLYSDVRGGNNNE